MVKALQDSTVKEQGTTKSVKYYGVQYTIMITILCKEIQEENTEIQELVIGFNSFIITTTTVHFLS